MKMRKLLLLIVALLTLGGSGAWAASAYNVVLGSQVTDLTNLSSDKYYVLKNVGSSRYTCYDEVNSQIDATADLDFSCVVKLNYDATNVTIQQVSTNTYYQGLVNNTRLTLGTSSVNFTFNTDGVEAGQFRFANNSLYLNRNGGGSEYPMGAETKYSGNYSRWNIYEVSLNVAAGYTILKYSKDLGSYTAKNDAGTWASKWESTANNPKVTLSTGANNIQVSSGNIYSGGGCTYTLKAQAGYVITGYSITGVAEETMTLKSVEKGTSVEFTKNAHKTLSVSDLCLPVTSFTQSSPNKGIALSNFEITLKPLTSVGTLGTLSNDKKYIITNNRGTWAVGSGATDVNSTVELDLAFSMTDYKQQFAIIYYDDETEDSNDGYYLYSVGENKFAYKNGSKLSLTPFTDGQAPSKVTFTASTNADYKDSYPVIVTIGGTMFGVSTGKSPDVFAYDVQNDGGNAAAIFEVGNFDATAALAALQDYFHPTHTITYIVKDESANPLFTSDAINAPLGTYNTLPSEYHRDYFFTYTTDGVTITGESAANTELIFTATAKSGILKYTTTSSAPEYYNLNIRSKYLVYDDDAIGDVTLQDESSPFNADASWAFIGDPYTGFKIINKTKGSDYNLTYTSIVTGGNGGSDGSNNNIQFVANDNDIYKNQYWYVEKNTGGFCLRMKENMNIYFHHQNVTGTNGYLRTCSMSEWSSVHNDEGSTIVESTDEDVLIALYNNMKNLVFASGVGEYSTTYVGTDGAAADIASIGTIIDMKVTAQYPSAYNTLLDIISKSTLNLPGTGFYRIKGKTSSKYLAAGVASNSKFAMSNAEDATTIFYFVDSKLINYSTGFYNGLVSGDGATGWTWAVGAENASTTTFKDGHTQGGYGIQSADVYIYDNGDGTNSADRGGASGINMETSDARYRSWQLTEVKSLPVTISSIGLSSFYSPVDVVVPEGVTAYTGTISGDYLILTSIETGQKIKANTGVILEGTANATVDFEITSGAPDPADNDLSGTVATKATTEGDLVLGNKNGKAGFYKYTGANLAGFKSYISVDKLGANPETKGLTFSFMETAIQALQEAGKSNIIYDLNGRRVQKAQKGIYIIDGKKVIIR